MAEAPDGVANGLGVGLGAADAGAIGHVDGAQVLNQGLAGLMVQFFEGGGGDGDGLMFGPGLQVAWSLADHAKHDLAHDGDISVFQLHPWTDHRFLRVPGDTGIRPAPLGEPDPHTPEGVAVIDEAVHMAPSIRLKRYLDRRGDHFRPEQPECVAIPGGLRGARASRARPRAF